jgi:hypothetical protein
MFAPILLLAVSALTGVNGQCLPSLGACVCSGTSISCSGYDISTIKAAILSAGLQNSVVILNLYHSREEVLPVDYVKDFPALTAISLRYGSLNSISFGAFNNGSLLQAIDLRNNRLSWLSGAMFTGITSNMNTLNIDNNNIQVILSDMEPIFSLLSDQLYNNITI